MSLSEVMDNKKKDSFSADEIAQEWKKSVKKRESYFMMGIYGLEGTAKSGVCLDALTPKEIKEGYKVAVIDIDDSCDKIWEDCLGCPEHVRIINPLITDEDDIDYIATYNFIVSFLSWFKVNAKKEKIKYVVIDGIDTLLKWCEFKMKIEFHGGEFAENQEIQYDWGKRNQMYYKVVRLLKSIPAHVIITAHMASDTYFEKDSNGRKQMVTEVSGANWHKGKQQSTADELYEIIHMRKRTTKSGIYLTTKYTGTVEKWKGNARMENRRFSVLETRTNSNNNKNDKIEWEGLIPKLISKNREDVEQTESKKNIDDDSDDFFGEKSKEETKKLKTKDRKKKDEGMSLLDDNENKDTSENSIDKTLGADISEELDEESNNKEDTESESKDDDEIDTSDDEDWLDEFR